MIKNFTYAIFIVLTIVGIYNCKKESVINDTLPLIKIKIQDSLSGIVFRECIIYADIEAGKGKKINKVEFYANGKLIENGIDSIAPYSCHWISTSPSGDSIQILVKAYDDYSFIGSDSLKVVVWNGVERKSIPTPRYAFTANTVNGKIYIIGGYNNDMNGFKVVEEYDPLTDTWTSKTSSKYGHAAHASCVINNIIYVFGGDEGFKWTSNVEAYNALNDTWETKTAIPADSGVGIGLQACGVINDKAYLFGGVSGFDNARTGIYDPASDTWQLAGTKGIYNAGCASYDNIIYLSGGCDVRSVGSCENPSNALQKYNPGPGTWTVLSPMPEKRIGHTICAINGKIYTLGGAVKSTKSSSCIDVYDIAGDVWTSLTPMPVNESNFAVAVSNNKIYIFGSTVLEYTPF